mmetsp:Transcript_27192/g.56635  ORF Transcript_27192/g.56635 Transcript_27192/m.56635 type:complete len:240 (-) Transcript_27192:364-1083(-)
MRTTTTAAITRASILLGLCAGIIIHTTDASNPTGNSLLPLRHRLPTAFCSPSNNTIRKPRRIDTTRTAKNDNSNDGNDGDDDGTSSSTGTWNPFALAVLKLGFTEPAWTSSYNYKSNPGIYKCANCNSPLFPSAAKYDSGSGWPSFWKTAASDRVALERSWDGRIEATCANCGGHLGHVFPDGPTRGSLMDQGGELDTVPETDPKIGYKDKSGDGDSKYSRMPRFCVNGIALRFEEEEQ